MFILHAGIEKMRQRAAIMACAQTVQQRPSDCLDLGRRDAADDVARRVAFEVCGPLGKSVKHRLHVKLNLFARAEADLNTLSILLLAAGASTRMRGPDKLLLKIDGLRQLRRIALQAIATGKPVPVTVSSDNPLRAAALQGLAVKVIASPDRCPPSAPMDQFVVTGFFLISTSM